MKGIESLIKERAVLKDARRVVVKVGTHSIAKKSGRPDYGALRRVVNGVCELRALGMEVLFVSSGAVAAGVEHSDGTPEGAMTTSPIVVAARYLHLKGFEVRNTPMKHNSNSGIFIYASKHIFLEQICQDPYFNTSHRPFFRAPTRAIQDFSRKDFKVLLIVGSE